MKSFFYISIQGLNGRRGLKANSEEGLEAMHKVVDKIKERGSRKTFFVAMTEDILKKYV